MPTAVGEPALTCARCVGPVRVARYCGLSVQRVFWPFGSGSIATIGNRFGPTAVVVRTFLFKSRRRTHLVPLRVRHSPTGHSFVVRFVAWHFGHRSRFLIPYRNCRCGPFLGFAPGTIGLPRAGGDGLHFCERSSGQTNSSSRSTCLQYD